MILAMLSFLAANFTIYSSSSNVGFQNSNSHIQRFVYSTDSFYSTETEELPDHYDYLQYYDYCQVNHNYMCDLINESFMQFSYVFTFTDPDLYDSDSCLYEVKYWYENEYLCVQAYTYKVDNNNVTTIVPSNIYIDHFYFYCYNSTISNSTRYSVSFPAIYSTGYTQIIKYFTGGYTADTFQVEFNIRFLSEEMYRVINSEGYEEGFSTGQYYGYQEGYYDGENDPTGVAYKRGYDSGYNIGYSDGYNSGYNSRDVDYWNAWNTGYDAGWESAAGALYPEYYQEGFDDGFNEGYYEGASSTNNFTFGRLFTSIADVPIYILRNLLGFEVFGIQAFEILVSMIGGVLALYIIRKFIL